MPRTREAVASNPTGVPVRYENGIWMPGDPTATQIQNNNQISRNTSTSSPKIEIGNVGGGEARSIPVTEAPANSDSPTGENPAPAETTGDPRIDALLERFNQQGEQINQLLAQQAQMLEVLQELVRQRGGEAASATGEPEPVDHRRPVSEVWDEAHAENARIDQERQRQEADPAHPNPTQEEWDEAHAENARIDQERQRQQEQAAQANLQQRSEQATQALNRSRDDLVRFTILRRARSFDLLHRGDAQAYEAARENYMNALRDFMGAQAESLRAQGVEEAEIIQRLAPMEYAEQRAFAERVYSMDQEMFESGQKSLRDRMLRRWANYSTKKKLLIGVLAGGAAGFASVGLGLGIAGVAVGLATRYAFGILNHAASARNVSEKSRNAEVARLRGREQREAHNAVRSRLRFVPNGQTADDYLDNDMIDRNSGYHDREMGRSRFRNRLGLGIMGASGLLVGLDLGGVGFMPHVLTDGWDRFAHDIGDKMHLGHHGGHNGSPFGPEPGHGDSDYASWDIKPSTIHANNMTEFNKGVVSLLQKQGVHVGKFNHHVLEHMNRYMENRPMASGMDSVHPQVQHLVSGEYTFGNPSHAQGFEIGTNGNGKAELVKWMTEAQRAGADIRQ